eukprot:gene1198-biopygen9530
MSRGGCSRPESSWNRSCGPALRLEMSLP